MQETNKAKISMSLVGREERRFSCSSFPTTPEVGGLDVMCESHQDRSLGHLCPLPRNKPWSGVWQAHHSLGM